MKLKLCKVSLMQKIVLFITIFIMALVWPICFFRRAAEERSGDVNHAFTSVIDEDGVIVQEFKPRESYLKAIDFAVTFDESAERSGSIVFELYNGKGKLLSSQTIDYKEVPDYMYYSVPIERWVWKNQLYYYKLSTVDMIDNLPRGIYTTQEADHVATNVEMKSGETLIEGQSLTRYIWKIPFNYRNVLCIWGGIGAVGFSFYEFLKKEKN